LMIEMLEDLGIDYQGEDQRAALNLMIDVITEEIDHPDILNMSTERVTTLEELSHTLIQTPILQVKLFPMGTPTFPILVPFQEEEEPMTLDSYYQNFQEWLIQVNSVLKEVA
jgi:hypothetical protein